MGLSTHVLDTANGCPASGMSVTLYSTHPSSGVGELEATLIKRFTLNHDGRCPDGMVLGPTELQAGTYRLRFDVSSYFKARGTTLPEPSFLGLVDIDFGVAHPEQHYHVPLLVSPFSYSTYRGS